MTTPNLASVAIRPLRRPAVRAARMRTRAVARQLPLFLIAELFAVIAMYFVAYTAVTDDWLGASVGTFSHWYTETVSPHLDPPLTVHTPPEMGPPGLRLVGRDTGVQT
ncbi:hypothetical protein RN607_09150 [Demequina capsici]|uniref:Uncharacterized protein n=1 Tax=Demequina capsici TaxID=3075620 RepID=A0AA96J6M4_9MICO|nr:MULTISPECIES: hypothetical protein [unclassified Demequina]WNM23490.1 hypothetical protein RN606_08925 [Demequina sp. OYTSA14]WNM26367.1 hypothetical protein RN607_09150 [Demequina sp. PMTSA13]